MSTSEVAQGSTETYDLTEWPICPKCGQQCSATAPASEDEEPPEPDGEAYRGGEAASALAEEQARIQRELK